MSRKWVSLHMSSMATRKQYKLHYSLLTSIGREWCMNDLMQCKLACYRQGCKHNNGLQIQSKQCNRYYRIHSFHNH